ncbi:O-antigen ligase family protein [Halalkaliarchaeum desulfuricum]|uniref:O-antigen ligase family protein n=1 Tax=Halalkaliarchaeum desulfuricum TaxID=2055893 RepID=UPI00137B5637|nr:O-antigen ligase family protein [Halalkaliarchaeum desulfuricum]
MDGNATQSLKQGHDITALHRLSLVLAVLLLLSVISRHTGIPSVASLPFITFVYVIILGVFLTISDLKIKTEKIYFMLFLLLSFSILLSTMFNLTASSFSRFGAFVVFTSMNLFILPKIIDFDHFLFASSRVTAGIVLLGFLPYLGGPTQIGVIDLSLWGARLYWYPNLSPLTSVFVGANWLGFLTLVGSLSAIGEWWKFKSSISKYLIFINFVGLLFTNYRTGWVAFAAAIGILAGYILLNRDAIVLLTAGGILTTVVALAMMFKIIPGPAFLTELSLNNRRGSWVAGADVFKQQYLLGYGFGNTADVVSTRVPPSSPANVHNSYLRAFLALGVGGGIAYLGLFLSTLFKSALEAVSKTGVLLSMFLVSFFIIQMFNSLTFIGISLHSVIISIVMGYQVTK